MNTIHYTACVAGGGLAKKTGVPLVATVQLGPIDEITSRLQRAAATYERVVGGYVLRLAPISRPRSVRGGRGHAIALGAEPAAVSLAPNGVEHERFATPDITGSANPLVLVIGRLTSNKGPDLFEAAAKLAGKVPFRVRFVGDGPMRSDLERRVAELGIGDVVEFVGQVADPNHTSSEKGEIVIRASYTEGLSLAIIEGMAAARCNIVSDIAANRELIVDGENGLLFKVGDANDLARALRTAVEDPALRTRLATRAKQDAAPLTWDNMARFTPRRCSTRSVRRSLRPS